MNTTTTYRVIYASAGCLPDSDDAVMYFDSLEDAAERVADERAGICWMDASGYREDASLSVGDVVAMLARFGMVGDPRPDSLYRWSIDELERVDEPADASIAWVCGNCIGHAANGECGDCPDHGDDDEPLSRFGDASITCGMFAVHHADDCPAHYGESDVECECEVVMFSHSRCDGCNGLPGERHAVTVWNDTDPR